MCLLIKSTSSSETICNVIYLAWPECNENTLVCGSTRVSVLLLTASMVVFIKLENNHNAAHAESGNILRKLNCLWDLYVKGMEAMQHWITKGFQPQNSRIQGMGDRIYRHCLVAFGENILQTCQMWPFLQHLQMQVNVWRQVYVLNGTAALLLEES